MNSINARFRSNTARTVEAIKSGGKKVGVAVAGTLISAQSAMAAVGGGFDESAITGAITANLGKALLVVGAFLVAVWTLRAMGLLGKR